MSYEKYLDNISDPGKDWERDIDKEVLTPVYDRTLRKYYVEMKNVIDGINNSKHPLDGGNVWLPDKDGTMIPLPDYIDKNGGGGSGGGTGGSQQTKQYRLEMVSTQGNILKDKDFTTVLKAILYEDNVDITERTDAKYFKWARCSGATEADQIADAQWNLKWAAGAKEIPITTEDVNRNAMFQVQFVTEAQSDLWIKSAYHTYMNKLNK